MAEPTCVMHSFSCTTPEFSNESHQENENPMYGLGESVSFGRFMTEDLSWERWSSFNDNNNKKRYVEEAEKYSRPGSVAQKKAYFEAHFKRVAALKAAALLDQANAAQDITQGSVEFEGEVEDGKGGHEGHVTSSFGQTRAKEEVDEKDKGFVVNQDVNGGLSSVGLEKLEVDAKNVEEEEEKEDDDPTKQNASLDQVEMNSVCVKDENSNDIKDGSSRVTQMIISTPLQEINSKEQASKSIVKKNPPLSSYLPSIDGISRTSLFTSSPVKSAASVYPGKENYATPIKQTSSVDDPDKKGTPLHMSINREFNKILSPVIRKIGSSSQDSKNGSTVSKFPAKGSINGIADSSPLNSNLVKRGDKSDLESAESRQNNLSTESESPSTGRNKISSPIIPACFCWSSKDRAAQRKQKLEEKFDATTTEKEKAQAGFNKFRLSFCFKAMSSPNDRCNVNETQKSPKNKRSTIKHGGSKAV